MTHLRHRIWGSGLARWRRSSPASLALGLMLAVAQVQQGFAAIVNDAVGVANVVGDSLGIQTCRRHAHEQGYSGNGCDGGENSLW